MPGRRLISPFANESLLSKRRLLVCVLLVTSVLGAGTSVVVLRWKDPLRGVREALAMSKFQRSEELLETALPTLPPSQQAEAEYLAAVICRRTGRMLEFDEHLNAALRLGWDKTEIERQRWLAQAQSGDLRPVESHLRRAIAEGVPDDVAEEIYEAIAKGHLAAFRLREAWYCLEHWLSWRADAPIARLLRGDIYGRRDNLHEAIADYQVVIRELPNHVDARVKLGNALIKLRKLTEAREQFDVCLGISPNDPAALLGMIECERLLGNPTAAEQHLASLLAMSLRPSQLAEALSAKGYLLLTSGKTDEALHQLKMAVALAPEESSIHHALARALTAAGHAEEAKFHLDEVKRISAQYERLTEFTEQLIDDPENAELRFSIGAIFLDQGLVDEGLHWLKTALRCDSGHSPTLTLLHARRRFQAGLQAFLQGDAATVQVVLDELAEQKHCEPHRALLAGMVFLVQSQYQEAISAFNDAQRHPETQLLALTLTGEAYYKRHQFSEAIRVLRIATTIDPLATDAHRWLAATYHDIGAMDDALRELAVVTEQDQQDPRPLRMMGLMYKDFEFFDKAIAVYREAIRLAPHQEGHAQIRLELGDCLVKQRKYREAIEVMSEAPDSAAAMELVAQCHHALGDTVKAREIVGEALAKQPHHVASLRLMARFQLEAGRIEDAISLLEKAKQHASQDWQLRYQLANAYQRAGKARMAKQQLDEMQQLRTLWERFSALHKKAIADPEDVSVRVDLGELALELQRPDLAANWFTAAIGIDPTVAVAPQRLEQIRSKAKGS